MINRIKKDVLIRGSLVLFVMLGLFNVFNYLFQMSMARMLGPADYGILAVLMSIIYIFGIPSEAIQTIITRYTSKFEISNETGKVKDILYRSLRKGILFSFAAFAVFSVLSIFLSSLLKISFFLLIITGLFIFYIFSLPVIRGVLQGKKKFFSLGLNMVMESGIKVIFSILLVIAGWRVYGAIGSVIIGGIIAFFFASASIRDVFSSKRKSENLGEVYRYNLPILIGISSIVLIYSLDVILARVFFSPEIAGKYSFVSLIGKIILFSSFAISKAMFPLSAEKFEEGKTSGGLLKKSLILLTGISVFVLFFCYIAPEQVIKLISLGSSQYTDASNVLFIIALAFSLTAFSNLFVLYSLSINKIRKASVSLWIFVVLYAVLLSIFNSSLVDFAYSILAVNVAMFLYSLWLVKK